MASLILLASVLLHMVAWAQQLNGTYMNIEYPGLTQKCKQALNTTVACPLFLARRALSNGILDAEAVNALCVSTCLTSLNNARARIVAGCNAPGDVIEFDTGTEKASYIIDNFLHAYAVSCRKDSSTGQFCDPRILEWSQPTFRMGSNETCSDCWLGGQALQLNNALGYDEGLANKFTSLTSSCSAQGKYSFTVPATTTNVGTSAITTTSTIPTPTCDVTYSLRPTDLDCHLVAKSLSVSSYDLVVANGIDLYCQNFAALSSANATICVPQKCQTYTWKAEDSCPSVLISRPGITMTQFLAWNPMFNALCRNTGRFIGYEICLSNPGGSLGTNTTAAPDPGGSHTVPVPAPTNAIPGSKPCGKWHNISPGDECGIVALANGITLDDFYFLNPNLNTNCTNLLLDVAYCVAAVGDISTYPGYPTPTRTGVWATISVPPVTFPSVNTDITTRTGNPGFVVTSTLLPRASGTVGDCQVYRNYVPDYPELNSCGYVAYAYDVSVDQLRQWNPSLPNGSGCVLKSGLSYCVESVGDNQPNPTLPSTPDTNCFDIAATEPGTSADCACFTQVRGYQNRNGVFTCSSIASSAVITLAKLLEWNPWLGNASSSSDKECTQALFANLGYHDSRAVCIGIGKLGATSTATATSSHPESTSSRGSETSASGPPAPTQTGIVAGCRKFHVVKEEEYCWLITNMYGISLEDFVKWNPSVGSDCGNVWLGYAYCVQGPG